MRAEPFPFDHLSLKEVAEWEVLATMPEREPWEQQRMAVLSRRKYHLPAWLAEMPEIIA